MKIFSMKRIIDDCSQRF